MEGQNKESEIVVEKRVARRVIRRRKKGDEEILEKEPEKKDLSLKGDDLTQKAAFEKTKKAASVQPATTQEIQQTPQIEEKKEIEFKQTIKEKIILPEEEKPKEEPRKNLTFKDRIQGSISLDKIKPVKKEAVSQGASGETEKTEDTDEKKTVKKERAVKKRIVKNIGGDLDIDGQGKATTLTHLVRTSVMDRVFRPEAQGGARGKKKIIARKKIKATAITMKKASKRVVEMTGMITVGNLAQQLGVKAAEIIKKLMDLGVMATINQTIDHDTVTLVAQEFDYTVKDISFKEEEILGASAETIQESPDLLENRPPIVTVMGHVDHGKTSLLDAIRSTSITEGESGGITQHIGAYSVTLPQGKITFLDTPGHEAFTMMRARGANVTDIVILVVAADDGLMPQTEESISHAQAAQVPIIVAINKMDLPEANPDKVLRQLSEKGLLAEEWGGDVLVMKVSAKKKEGISELLESILLQAEILELKANPNKNARGTVIEAKLDKGRGPVCTLLIQEGKIKTGDAVVAGPFAGRVRAMQNWKGENLTEAGPSTAVEVLGLEGLPQASDPFDVVDSEQNAKTIAEHRGQQTKEAAQSSKTISLEDMFAQMKAGEVKEFNFILKGDAQGSLEAIEQSIKKIGNEEVKPKIIHTGVGAIKESDVQLATASQAVILGFHVRPETKAIHLAKEKGIEIKLYKVIYDLVDEVKLALSGLLAPQIKETYLGRAEVRETFQVSKFGLIAGCMVVDGVITRQAKLRLLRDNVVIIEGEIASLKRFKDDAKEVKQGFECGIGISSFQDIKTGDTIEAYTLEEIKRSL